MTIEEIERTLQTITEQNASATARQQRLEETVQDVMALHQQVLRNHEARQGGLEEAFRRVAEAHQTLVQLVGIHEERLADSDSAQAHTDARLDGLIDTQIDFSERLTQLAAKQAEHKREADERGARLDEKLAQLQEAQARAAEQVRALIERNGSEKPKAGSQKPKKSTKKRGAAK
jgi:DNA repair exonuclease SbcCD ATPase subunit